MEWFDDDDFDEMSTAVIDAAIALRVACWFARPRGPGSRLASRTTRGFDELVDELLDDVGAAASVEAAARALDRLCEVLAETANATEKLAQMPGALRGWNELLHGRAELALAYQRAAAMRWKAWCAAAQPMVYLPNAEPLKAAKSGPPRWGTVGQTL